MNWKNRNEFFSLALDIESSSATTPMNMRTVRRERNTFISIFSVRLKSWYCSTPRLFLTSQRQRLFLGAEWDGWINGSHTSVFISKAGLVARMDAISQNSFENIDKNNLLLMVCAIRSQNVGSIGCLVESISFESTARFLHSHTRHVHASRSVDKTVSKTYTRSRAHVNRPTETDFHIIISLILWCSTHQHHVAFASILHLSIWRSADHSTILRSLRTTNPKGRTLSSINANTFPMAIHTHSSNKNDSRLLCSYDRRWHLIFVENFHENRLMTEFTRRTT